MATKIRGVTIEIGGDTSKLQGALKDTNNEIKKTQSQLKDVERLLKLDPKNTELLRQKQELLGKAIGETKDKLDTLRDAEAKMKSAGVDQNSDQFMALKREIIATEGELKKLTDETKNTKAGFDKIKEAADKVAQAADKVAKKTRPLSAAGAALSGALLGAGMKSISTADDLATLSKRTGVSTASLQKFAYASDMVDVSVEEITGSLQKMKKTLSGNPEAFTKLGIAVKNTDGSFRNIEDIFMDSLSALSKIGGETERDLVAMELFGRSADTLATIIDDGGEGLKAYGEQAQELGLILSEDTINRLTESGDKIDEIKARAEATIAEVGATLLENLAPTIDVIVEKIGEVLAFLGSLDSDTLNLIVTIGLVIAAISPIASLISGISSAVSGVSTAIGFLTERHLLGPLGIVGAVVAVVTIIATKGEEIKNILNTVSGFLKNIFQTDWTKTFGALGNILNAFGKVLGDVFGGIKKILTGIIDFIRGVFAGDWSRAWEGVKGIFEGIFGTLAGIAKAPINAIIGILNGLIDGLNWIIGGINKISFEVPSWVPFIGGNRVGFNLGYIGKLAYLAQGGILTAGSAIVGENGPELLTMNGDRAIVQPLTNNTTNQNYGGVTLNIYGAAGQNIEQLAEIIMDEIGNATRRQEAVFA